MTTAAEERATRNADLVARVGLLALAAVQASKRLADFDLPWHLSLGRYEVAHRALPRVDPLAFTHRPIQYMEFPSDLGLWASYASGGALGLQLLGALLFVAILLLTLRRCREAGPLALVVLAVTAVAIGNWMIVRPATLSLLLLPLTLHLLESHRREPTARRARIGLVALVPLSLVWVNAHGFAVIGIVLIVGYAAYRGACRVAAGRLGSWLPVSDASDLGRTGAVAAGALAVSGVNLAGYRIWLGPLAARGDFARIGEWLRPTLGQLLTAERGLSVLIVLAIIALAFGREPGAGRWPNAFDTGLWLSAVVLGQSAFRMLPVAALMVAPSIARRLSTLTRPTRRLPLLGALTLPLAAPLVALNTPTSFGVGFERHFPEPAVRWVESHDVQGRMWNFMDWGGYLSFRLYPRHLVFVDGRSGWVHDPAMLQRYWASLKDDVAFRSLVSDLSLEWAITRAGEREPVGGPLAKDVDFTMVYLDDQAAVYVRRDGANRALANQGYRSLRHVTGLPVVLQAAVQGSVPPADLLHDGELAATQAPESPRAAFLLAAGAIAVRDATKLRAARARLEALAPGHPTLGILDRAAEVVGLGSSARGQ
jgi:hypothetical protein